MEEDEVLVEVLVEVLELDDVVLEVDTEVDVVVK